jgi:hypothetical protein
MSNAVKMRRYVLEKRLKVGAVVFVYLLLFYVFPCVQSLLYDAGALEIPLPKQLALLKFNEELTG